MYRSDITLTLLKVDDEAYEDTGGCTGGPDYNLGKEYSIMATWATSSLEMPYYSVETITYVNGYLLDHTGERVDSDLATYDDARDADGNPLPSHTEADFGRGVWVESGEPIDPKQQFVQYFEQCYTEFTYHSDPGNPQDSEILTEVEYDDHVGYLWPTSLEEAEENCKNYLNHQMDVELWYNWSI